MCATRLWNKKQGQSQQTIYGVITTGDNWLFFHFKEGNTIEIGKKNFYLMIFQNF